MSEELIEDFISTVYTPEYASLVRQAISLFEAFEHQNAYGQLIDSITNESVSDIHGRAEHFGVALGTQLDYILKEHLVYLTDEATHRDRVDVCDALYRLQHLEDYTVISNILTSDEDSVDKMSRVLEHLTQYDRGYILSILKEVDERTIHLLETFVINKETKPEADKIKTEILVRINLMTEAFGRECLGFMIVEAGMTIGLPARLYIPLVEDDLVVAGDDERTAENILSVLCISDVTDNEIINTYRQISETLIKDLSQSGRVEAKITYLMAKLEEHRKAYNEKIRISKTGTT